MKSNKEDLNLEDLNLPKEECWNTIKKFGTLNNIDVTIAVVGITKLIQNGGTNQSKKNLTVTVSGKEFELKQLREMLKSQDKTYTVRKFAKGAREIIIEVAKKNQWAGPLVKDLARANPNLKITPENAPRCNEIHSDIHNCLNEIRDALIRREEQYKMMFKNRSAPLNRTSKKPRKQGGKNKKR